MEFLILIVIVLVVVVIRNSNEKKRLEFENLVLYAKREIKSLEAKSDHIKDIEFFTNIKRETYISPKTSVNNQVVRIRFITGSYMIIFTKEMKLKIVSLLMILMKKT